MYSEILFAGFGGQGVILAGKILCIAAKKRFSYSFLRGGDERRNGKLLRRYLRWTDCFTGDAEVRYCCCYEHAVVAEI